MDQEPQTQSQPVQEPQPTPAQPVVPSPTPVQQPPQSGVPIENPGQTLGIVGLVCNFLGIGIAGIVLGIMSRNKSKQANMSTTLGTISLVWGIVETVLVTLSVIFFIFVMILAATSGTIDPTTTDTSSLYTTN